MPTGILQVEVGFGWVGIARFRKYFDYTRQSCSHAVHPSALSAQTKRCVVRYTNRVYYHCYNISATVGITKPPFLGQGNGGRKHEDLSTVNVELNTCSTICFIGANLHPVHRTCFLLCQEGQRVRFTRRFFIRFFFTTWPSSQPMSIASLSRPRC